MPESIKKTLSESDDDDGDDAALPMWVKVRVFFRGIPFPRNSDI